MIEFGRLAAENRSGRRGKPETFDFLGFTTSVAERKDAWRVRQTCVRGFGQLREVGGLPLAMARASRWGSGWLILAGTHYYAVP